MARTISRRMNVQSAKTDRINYAIPWIVGLMMYSEHASLAIGLNHGYIGSASDHEMVLGKLKVDGAIPTQLSTSCEIHERILPRGADFARTFGFTRVSGYGRFQRRRGHCNTVEKKTYRVSAFRHELARVSGCHSWNLRMPYGGGMRHDRE